MRNSESCGREILFKLRSHATKPSGSFCGMPILSRTSARGGQILRKLRNVAFAEAVQELPDACSAGCKILRELRHSCVIISVGLNRGSSHEIRIVLNSRSSV